LDNACGAADVNITLVLCHDTEVSLTQAKRSAKHSEDSILHEGVANTYVDLGNLLYSRGHYGEAQTSFKKAQKLG
jgi:uncharacterized protein HemY